MELDRWMYRRYRNHYIICKTKYAYFISPEDLKSYCYCILDYIMNIVSLKHNTIIEMCGILEMTCFPLYAPCLKVLMVAVADCIL